MDSIRRVDVLGSETINGEPRLNVGRVSTGKGQGANIGLWGPEGYIAIPNPPANGESAQAICIQEASTLSAIAVRDNRFSEKTGTLEPGDRMIVTDGEARLVVKQATDSITNYTVNKKTNLSMMSHLDGENGIAQLVNGNAQVSVEDKRIVLAVNGGGSIVIDAEGVHIGGKQFNADCGGGTFGLVGGVARPPVGINSIVAGPAGQTGVGSTAWTVAT